MSDHYRFADLEWQSRWNSKTAPHLSLFQHGSRMSVTAFFGVILYDMKNSEDVEAIATQAEMFAKAVREHKAKYDEWREEHGL